MEKRGKKENQYSNEFRKDQFLKKFWTLHAGTYSMINKHFKDIKNMRYNNFKKKYDGILSDALSWLQDNGKGSSMERKDILFMDCFCKEKIDWNFVKERIGQRFYISELNGVKLIFLQKKDFSTKFKDISSIDKQDWFSIRDEVTKHGLELFLVYHSLR